jgi:hypothetical protein
MRTLRLRDSATATSSPVVISADRPRPAARRTIGRSFDYLTVH